MKYTIIKLNLYFMVYSIVLKFEKIWLSGTLNIIRKPKKGHNSGTVNVKYTVIELTCILWYTAICESLKRFGCAVLNYYPETKSVTDGRTDMRIPIYPRLSSIVVGKINIFSYLKQKYISELIYKMWMKCHTSVII